MGRVGLLVAAIVWTGSASVQAQSLAGLTSRGFGIPLVTAAHVVCTDVPTATEPVARLQILAGHSPDLHEQFTAGEMVVLTATMREGMAAGQQYYIRRLQRSRDGRSPSVLEPGAILTAGWLTVVAADEHSSVARIDYACNSPRVGDYLEPFLEPTMAGPTGPDGPLQFENPAKVLFGRDQREALGAGELISVDRGTALGMTPGTRIVVFRDRGNGAPLVEIGEGYVVTAEVDSARVLVTRARDAIKNGDWAVTRGR